MSRLVGPDAVVLLAYSSRKRGQNLGTALAERPLPRRVAGQLGVVLGLRARLLTKENLFLPPGSPRLTLLAAAPLYLPALRSILETEPLNLTGIGLAAATALTGFIAARFVRTAFHVQSRTTMISHD
ncbi:hypothetical protein [Streptomyces sp. NPDC051546]|uniref:hypothetical protein n=1 Tax=Streptomyces sp. NPDC051546 TaxID=3365655 RepID=UPI00379A7207